MLSETVALRLYRTMLLIRRFEEMVISLYGEQEMRTPVHLCIGQEAIAAGVCENLRQTDYLFSTHRNHGHCLAKGVKPESLFAEFYCKSAGCAKGKGGSMHPVAPEFGIPGTTAIVGGGIPIAVGTALASVMRGSEQITVVFFGDGAVEEGTFHESLNFASLKKLPVIFVCENNYYATGSPIRQRQPEVVIADRAKGYGMPGEQIDGNDASQVYEAASQAVARARDGGGPALIEALTYRWLGHVGTADDVATGHRPPAELESWKKRCPLASFRARLSGMGWLPDEVAWQWEDEIRKKLLEAVQFAKNSPEPDIHEMLTDVFA